MPPGSADGEGWNGLFHPDDQERAWETWQNSLSTGNLYEIEYRLRHKSGAYHWTLGRALPVRGPTGLIIRWIGTCTDIHDFKRMADHNELLSRELSHRIKNIFSVINGLIGLSARQEPQIKRFAKSLQQRLAALGRAHEFARPHTEVSQPAIDPSTVKILLANLLSPYPALSENRLIIQGDDIEIDHQSAASFALIFHELATNAAKYGALKFHDSKMLIEIVRTEDNLTILLKENTWPETITSPEVEGFGSTLTKLSVGQLDGSLIKTWKGSGLTVAISVPTENISRKILVELG